MSKISLNSIPLGMHRSVEKNNPTTLHSVRDASLTGCKQSGVVVFFTERCIPNGIQIQSVENQVFKLLNL